MSELDINHLINGDVGISLEEGFDPEIEIPTCIFCQNPFSISEGRTPYILPCLTHNSCK